ncbi:unnamed protein product [Rotaria magnacalcarata]|uniref:Uncharacterized protein n=1 Tax=Rotaria magnacalcarata TaxID=392030 RepID=A0A816MVI3_9BILA|nr:unnamed protein product [Rotaria magnacalcarata]CAF4394490.1 unnamed protein product [Rotaria magnacalcarata]
MVDNNSTEIKKEKHLTKNDYINHFNPTVYLNQFFVVQNTNLPTTVNDFFISVVIKVLHEHKNKLQGKQRVLEFGCGPVLEGALLLAQYFNEIWLCDYAPLNLQLIQEWKDNKLSAFDWKPYFNFILDKIPQDNRKNLVEYEAKLRQALINGKLFRCDVNGDNSLFVDCDEPEDKFDMIYTKLCLEAACSTYDVLQRTINRFTDLLKPGGILLICSCRNSTVYDVDNYSFRVLPINEEIIRTAFVKTGKLTEPICMSDDNGMHPSDRGDGVMINYAFKT